MEPSHLLFPEHRSYYAMGAFEGSRDSYDDGS